MSKGSGIRGKTLYQAARARGAEGRQQVRDSRTTRQQLRELELRPGEARRERARLAG